MQKKTEFLPEVKQFICFFNIHFHVSSFLFLIALCLVLKENVWNGTHVEK